MTPARFPAEAQVFEVTAAVYDSMPPGTIVECVGRADYRRGTLNFRSVDDPDPCWRLSFDPGEVQPLSDFAREMLAAKEGL